MLLKKFEGSYLPFAKKYKNNIGVVKKLKNPNKPIITRKSLPASTPFNDKTIYINEIDF